jgi:hypothetical protein
MDLTQVLHGDTLIFGLFVLAVVMFGLSAGLIMSAGIKDAYRWIGGWPNEGDWHQ